MLDEAAVEAIKSLPCMTLNSTKLHFKKLLKRVSVCAYWSWTALLKSNCMEHYFLQSCLLSSVLGEQKFKQDRFFSSSSGFISLLQFKGDLTKEASKVTQWSRVSLLTQETQEKWVWSLGREDPLEEEMATHSSILAWRIPWTEEPGGLQSIGLQRVRCNWAHTHKVILVLSFCPL